MNLVAATGSNHGAVAIVGAGGERARVCAGARLEGAYLSGLAAAAEVLGRSGGPARSTLVGGQTAG